MDKPAEHKSNDKTIIRTAKKSTKYTWLTPISWLESYAHTQANKHDS